jgi:tetratricopeptide (TPR) repeat protein
MDVTEVLLKHSDRFLPKSMKDIKVESSANSESDKISHLIKLGRNFEQKGYYKEAIKCYKQIEKFNCVFTSLTLIANCYYKSGQFELAESNYLESLLHSTTDLEVLFNVYKNLGNLHLKSGQHESAEQFYLKAYSINPKSDDLLVNLATLDLQKGDEALALEKFRHALFANEQNDKAWSGLSLVYELFGERELSMGCIKKAIDINPNNLNALHIYSQLCVKNKTPSVAIRALEQWHDNHDFNINACLYLIELYIHNSEFIKARFMVNLGFLWEPKNLSLFTWDETLKSHGI